jgi:hypothetical protein
MSASCYLVPEILPKLKMNAKTFARLRKAGALPFLEELKPRLGRRPRYRADLIDRYLDGRWGTPVTFGAARAAR